MNDPDGGPDIMLLKEMMRRVMWRAFHCLLRKTGRKSGFGLSARTVGGSCTHFHRTQRLFVVAGLALWPLLLPLSSFMPFLTSGSIVVDVADVTAGFTNELRKRVEKFGDS